MPRSEQVANMAFHNAIFALKMAEEEVSLDSNNIANIYEVLLRQQEQIKSVNVTSVQGRPSWTSGDRSCIRDESLAV